MTTEQLHALVDDLVEAAWKDGPHGQETEVLRSRLLAELGGNPEPLVEGSSSVDEGV